MNLISIIDREVFQNYIVMVSQEPNSKVEHDVKCKPMVSNVLGDESFRDEKGYTTDLRFVKKVLSTLSTENLENKFYSFCLIVVNEHIRQITETVKKIQVGFPFTTDSVFSLKLAHELLFFVNGRSPVSSRLLAIRSDKEIYNLTHPQKIRKKISQKLLIQAQHLALKGSIGAAACALEKYRGRLERYRRNLIGSSLESQERIRERIKEEMLDICQGFDIHNGSIGSESFPGITTVEEYDTTILLAEKPEESIAQNTDRIKEILAVDCRGLVFFKQADQIFHCLRLEDKNLMIYDRKNKTWIACDASILIELDFKREDLLISLGREILAFEKVSMTFAEHTPDSFRLHLKRFYQEAQGPSKTSCVLHATNAFFGFPAIDMHTFYHFSRMTLINRLGLSRETIYSKNSITDTRGGADPGIISEYIETLANEGILPSKYGHLNIVKIKEDNTWNEGLIASIPENCDRVLIAYGGSHFAALRKDTHDHLWYLVESMDRESQDTPYGTLAQAIKSPSRAAAVTALSIIYSH